MAEEIISIYPNLRDIAEDIVEIVGNQEYMKKQEKQDSACKHDEDVCQHCLEKVQTTTTKEEEEEDSPPPLTAEEKRNKIFWDFSFLAVSGVTWYLTNKWFSDIVIDLLDSILDTIATPTE